MSDMISMQNLIGSVHGLKQTMEATRLYVLLHSNSNNCNISEYHSRFSQLMNKYSGFAENFRVELDEFEGLLSRNITKQQLEQEREKEKLMEKLEIMSNNNLEIDDNLTECDYTPAASVTNEPKEDDVDNDNIDNISCSEPEPVPVSIKSKPIKVVKEKKKTKKTIKKTNIRKNAAPNKKKKSVVTKTKKNEKKEEFKNNDDNIYNNKEDEYVPYKYNGNNWRFHGVERSSTMIYIGGLPNHIKEGAIQFFVMKKAKITMNQIEETQLKHGGRGKYALVRFRSDVTMDRIVKFIDVINAENSKIAEDKRKSDNMIPNKRKNDKNNKNENGMKQKQNKNKNKKTSWQTRVFLKFNNTFKYYESEESMFNDPSARNELFIRNFDILNSQCHRELTDILLSYGELQRDIQIKTDFHGDPYCIATFKYIQDAIWCCNDAVTFNGRTLEMRYSKY